MTDIHTVLCVGTPPELRDSRLLVLQSAGYDAQLVDAAGALDLLQGKAFDILLLSVTLSEAERMALSQAAAQVTRVIQLEAFTAPQDLVKLLAAQRRPTA